MPYVASYEREWKKAGKREGKLETAKKMLEDNLLIESIVKYTGLSESEIKRLMN